MKFSLEHIDELKMLGNVVLYRPANKLLGAPVVAGMVTAYNAPTGKASLVLVGHGYSIPNVSYSPTLDTPNTWCYKTDIETIEILPSNAPESGDESCAQSSASEDDTVVTSPSQEARKPSTKA